MKPQVVTIVETDILFLREKKLLHLRHIEIKAMVDLFVTLLFTEMLP
jgi:hypothetical protein